MLVRACHFFLFFSCWKRDAMLRGKQECRGGGGNEEEQKRRKLNAVRCVPMEAGWRSDSVVIREQHGGNVGNNVYAVL